MLGPVGEPGSCAFCGANDDEAGVRTQERLGVPVDVCAACRERFAGAARPAVPRQVAPVAAGTESKGLPPTLGQQSSAVFDLVRRMARAAAERPYRELECPHCGHLVHVYPTAESAGEGGEVGGGEDGEVGLAKEAVLATTVPADERWRVTDGIAAPATDLDEDDEDSVGARVRHDVVCPANPAPANPRLSRMWHNHLNPPPPEF